MNWRSLLMVFGTAMVAFIVYDVVVGPAITSIATKPEAKQ